MNPGAFSLSLSVRDIKASRAFYEQLGFSVTGGDPDKGWAILKNGGALIGLFQGMFEGNMLTFNPGWDQDGQAFEPFDDVRDIQRHLRAAGVEIVKETEDGGAGPAHIVVKDPDGNVILIDQHR